MADVAEIAREVPCPRCHEPCGWCSDPRHMHGKLKLPLCNQRCTLPEPAPEGENCPLCHGAMRVLATTTYAPVRAHLKENGDG
jgi:hypothetical protein